MRKTKFRALVDDMSMDWVYGNLIYDSNGNPRIQTDKDYDSFVTCLKGTECQFTGLYDKDRKVIYEGDIITNGKLKGDIKFGKYKHYFGNSSSLAIGFYLDGDENFYLSEILKRGDFSKIEIIGNKFENPELLK